MYNPVIRKAYRFGHHTNIDIIHPAAYFSLDTDRVKSGLFMGIDPSLAERIAKDGIVAGGRNFGCGSSREVSAQAFVLNGIHIIIAESFARIFFRNCLNLGMCLIEVPDLLDEVAEGDLLEIHPAAGVIINQTKDKRLEEVRVSMR